MVNIAKNIQDCLRLKRKTGVKTSLNQGITDDLQDRIFFFWWGASLFFSRQKFKEPQIRLQGYGEGHTVSKDHSFGKLGNEKESKGMLTRRFCESI